MRRDIGVEKDKVWWRDGCKGECSNREGENKKGEGGGREKGKDCWERRRGRRINLCWEREGGRVG